MMHDLEVFNSDTKMNVMVESELDDEILYLSILSY